MIRKFLIASMVLALAGFGFAQTTITISPSTSTEADEIAMGVDEAVVNQLVELILPQATALHLTASTLSFDMTKLSNNWINRAIGATDDDGPQCVYAVGSDATSVLGSEYWGQTQVVPGGVPYQASAGNYPNITVAGTPVVNYPPLQLSGGKLVDNSKNHFVCYQSFIIQLFSNSPNWNLQVSRADAEGAQGIEHLYVQGNTCSDFGTVTGLYELKDGADVNLIPRSLTTGPTGNQVNATCGNVNTSWLDVLGVIGVKVNSDTFGTSTADLTYTLMTSGF